ncbi:MAG: DUF4159 domain-containing protein, partial [Flavobacterium sp.]
YNGGGDWYANPTSLPNLIKFCNTNIKTKIVAKPVTVEPSNPNIFDYPYIHATGHGNIVFSDQEIKNLRNYILSGGFLHIDDNFGMDKYVRKEIKRLFPDLPLVALPAHHKIFQFPYSFSSGLPKIHEHENQKPEAFAIIINNRIGLLYTFETDLGDGWEDQEVHNNPKEVREKALKMGANIIHYCFN